VSCRNCAGQYAIACSDAVSGGKILSGSANFTVRFLRMSARQCCWQPPLQCHDRTYRKHLLMVSHDSLQTTLSFSTYRFQVNAMPGCVFTSLLHKVYLSWLTGSSIKQ